MRNSADVCWQTNCLSTDFRGRPTLGKRSVVRPQARWSDDLRRTAGGSWMRVAEDRARWRTIGLCSSVECSGLMMMMPKVTIIHLVLIDQQSVGKRSLHLMDTVNAKKRWTTIYWRVNNF
jgi:hypothetical protein